MRLYSFLLIAISLISLAAGRSEPGSFQFAIIGDRTGEAQSGVYEKIWEEVGKENPKFVLSVGDTIQGLRDQAALAEWQEIRGKLLPYNSIPLYLAPGNHDIWSRRSEQLFQQFSHHAPHYSFNFGELHVTVLDTSRSDTLTDVEMRFLEDDLKAHSQQPLKIVVSHRPFWLFPVLFGMSQSQAHQLLLRYGVKYVFTGHLHKMLNANLDGITYVCMPSAGGHLRDTKRYEDGWFFGHATVQVIGKQLAIHFEEVGPPLGKGRVSSIDDWGVAGLVKRAA